MILIHIGLAFLLVLFLSSANRNHIKIDKNETENWDIFRPFARFTELKRIPALLAPPEAWLQELTERFEYLDFATRANPKNMEPPSVRAKVVYIEMLIQFISGTAYGAAEKSVYPALRTKKTDSFDRRIDSFDGHRRQGGSDWPYLGVAMSGKSRLHNVVELIMNISQRNIEGDYIETGVWRGGSSILARAALRLYGQGHRISFVSDSFAGLPPGEKRLHDNEAGYDGTRYLEVDALTVAKNFHHHGLLDQRVIFVKGFFNDTMGPLARRLDRPLAIMRLDGDMYASTVDVLYNLYDKLSMGGYVIIDDWAAHFGAKKAVLDFMEVHACDDLQDLVMIDEQSMYWQKKTKFKIDYKRYEQKRFWNE